VAFVIQQLCEAPTRGLMESASASVLVDREFDRVQNQDLANWYCSLLTEESQGRLMGRLVRQSICSLHL